jgi:hypothetical protein
MLQVPTSIVQVVLPAVLLRNGLGRDVTRRLTGSFHSSMEDHRQDVITHKGEEEDPDRNEGPERKR